MRSDVSWGIGGVLGARGPHAWQPPLHIQDAEDPSIVMDFEEFFESQLLKGRSLRSISTILQVSLSAFLRFIKNNPHLDQIRREIIKKWPEMIREAAMESAMSGNITMQIYLSKTIGGLGDGAQPIEEEDKPKPVPAMTKTQALKLVETMRNNNVSAKS